MPGSLYLTISAFFMICLSVVGITHDGGEVDNSNLGQHDLHLIQSKKSNDCGLCHLEQHQQWANSFHATAMGPGVLGQFELFDEQTIVSCLECHAPSGVEGFLADESFPELDAVGCVACHELDGRRVGPRGIEITPHGPVHESPLVKQSLFCKRCHQFGDEGILVNGKPLENTYEEWSQSRYAAEGVSCQDCHMKNAEHRFLGVHDSEMVRSSIEVAAKRSTDKLRITLKNIGAGHALPTYITPRIRVIWREADTLTTLYTIQRSMDWNEDSGWTEMFDTRLAPDEKREIAVPIHSSGEGRVEVWVDPDADYYERVYPAILDALKESGATQKSIGRIQQAMHKAGRSSYSIITLYCGEGDNVACD